MFLKEVLILYIFDCICARLKAVLNIKLNLDMFKCVAVVCLQTSKHTALSRLSVVCVRSTLKICKNKRSFLSLLIFRRVLGTFLNLVFQPLISNNKCSFKRGVQCVVSVDGLVF